MRLKSSGLLVSLASLASGLTAAIGCSDAGQTGVSADGSQNTLAAAGGLQGEYFADKTFTNRALTRIDPTVNFDWGMNAPAAGVPQDNFSVRWTGFIQIPTAATYTFYSTSDDGARLYIDDQLVVNDFSDHGVREASGSIALTAGSHRLKYEYYDSGWDAVAKLAWSSPAIAKQTIPQNVLSASAGTGANTEVEFAAHGAATSVLSVGSCISTYDGDGTTNLIKGTNAALWKQYLTNLGPLVWRIPLYYHDGQVGSSAGGIHKGNEGEAYITAIKSIGGTPMIAIGGTTGDNDIRASDAAALVHYFNDNGGQHGGPVDYFIVGNEPDNGPGLNGVKQYTDGLAGTNDSFVDIAKAMRASTSRRLYIAGPALTNWEANDDWGESYPKRYKYFMAGAASQADILDFHKYGNGSRYGNLSTTYLYGDAVRWFQGQIPTYFGSRAGQIGVQAGEFNYHPNYGPDGDKWRDVFYTSRNTVHTASVIGQMLTAGGRAYQYSDSNSNLGLITDGRDRDDQPPGQHVRLPAYWGIAAWTGGAWFRRYGAWMARAQTTLPDFEVYATDAPRKVILVNKSATDGRDAEIDLVGVTSGTYSTWQFGPGLDPASWSNGVQFQPPAAVVKSQPIGASGHLRVTVPAMSVVVMLVD